MRVEKAALSFRVGESVAYIDEEKEARCVGIVRRKIFSGYEAVDQFEVQVLSSSQSSSLSLFLPFLALSLSLSLSLPLSLCACFVLLYVCCFRTILKGTRRRYLLKVKREYSMLPIFSNFRFP